ncbi:hypothetical protein GIB67_013032 [Kingdonia uniflora]|uniref:Uncharacterized protein n=1 Tax=Kingdonia uniflora TaxID=39325 RepID=A0A7J7MCF7_9MAGN|nr:hypothetical protein GIB67_013032 [Kingdonia uniflora]
MSEGEEEMQVGRAINQIDVASEGMPMPMEREVQEQVVAKALEKEEQLFELSLPYLSLLQPLLFYLQSVSGKYENFLRLVNKEVCDEYDYNYISIGFLGFACMVLVLWSPVVIPLFPTLVQGSALRNSTGIAEYGCVAGLYTAVTILMG